MMPAESWRYGDTITTTSGRIHRLATKHPQKRPLVVCLQTTAGSGRALEQFEGSVHDALAQTEANEYEINTRKLSL